MLKVTTYNRKAIKILRDQSNREHRKYHLDRAKDIRAKAEELSDVLERERPTLEPDYIEFLEQQISDLKLYAIKEENLRCMEKH